MASATETETRTTPETIPQDNVVGFIDTDWEGYQALLRIRGERPAPRILYLDGSLTLESPAMPHELLSRRLGLLVTEISVALRLPLFGIGSTTMGREMLECGVEGDQTFYIANSGRILGKEELDLNVDPPPDLVIEVVVSHSATKAMEIYRRLGVPELWICTPKRLRFYRLDDGDYVETPNSVAIPFLSASEVFSLIGPPHLINETEWTLRLRDWIRDELLPRARGEERPGGA